jgi:hypothetical protein
MAKTYVTGDQQSDQSVISSIMRKRGFIPRLNEVDTQTRENRKDRKANVEVLPASTAIINVYQLIDKVDSKGKKFKKYYPNQKPGIGFAGFNKIRGKLQASEEEVIEKPAQSQKAEPKATTKREAEPTTYPAASEEVQKLRDRYEKFAHGKKVNYTSGTARVGNIDGYQDSANSLAINEAYRRAAVNQISEDDKATVNTAGSSQKKSSAAEKKIKSDQASARQPTKPSSKILGNATLEGKKIITLLDKTYHSPYFADDRAGKFKNDSYTAYSLLNDEDIPKIKRAIEQTKKNKSLADINSPFPTMALVGTQQKSPATSEVVYVKNEAVIYGRKKKMTPSKVKRPLHKKPLVRGNKRKVVLRKKGGKR